MTERVNAFSTENQGFSDLGECGLVGGAERFGQLNRKRRVDFFGGDGMFGPRGGFEGGGDGF